MAKVEEITDANAKPSAMGRLGTTDDWTITVWCDQCDVWHHYFAEKIPRGKSFDVWELEPHLEKALPSKANVRKRAANKAANEPKNGELVYFGRFKSVDVAAEKLEEALADEDEDEDDDDDEDDGRLIDDDEDEDEDDD